MKQVVQTLRSGLIEVADVPVPGINESWVLVRTTRSVISAGTEKSKVDLGQMNLFQKARSRPDLVKQVIAKARYEGLKTTFRTVDARLSAASPLGYSSSGVVVAVGGAVRGLAPGDRVACAGAGYANHAEFAAIPANLIAPVPDSVSDEAAAFTTLGSIALQGVRLLQPQFGERFLVIGLGLLGQITTQILRANGCQVFGFDPQPGMVSRAQALGAIAYGSDADLDRALLAATDNAGIDGVVITAGTPSNAPIELAGRVTRRKGRVVVVGAVKMDIPREDYFKKELSVVVSCSYGPGRYDPRYEEQGHDYPIGYVRFTEQRNMVAFLQAIEAGRIDLAPLVTHRFPIERAAEAYEIVRSGSEPHVGIVLEYSSTQQIHESTGSIRVGKVRSTGTRASFVGAGNYTTATLLPAIKSSTKFSLSGLMTQSGRSAQSVANQFGFAFCTDRLDDIIGPDSDVVFIATRHDSHADLVVRALNAGKHVFVEKPLGLTIDELVAIRAAHRSSPGTLLVGFNRRFAPMTKSVLDRFSSTPGPRVVDIRVNAGQLPSDHWMFDPANGGRLIGEGCHFVDLACVLVGQPVTEVFAFAHAGQQVSRVTTDNIVSVLRFADGSVASITYLSVGARSVAKERIEVHAGGGSAIIDDWTTLTIHGADGRSNEVKGPQDKGQRNMVRALEAAICDGAEAVDSSELLLSSFATVLLAETLLIGMPLRLQDVVDLA